MKLLAATFLVLQLCACATLVPNESHPIIVEGSQRLGFGFKSVSVAKLQTTGFEGIGHFQHFYYKDKKLCSLGEASISPSGNFAIYQDGPSGFLFLFRRSDQQITQLSTEFLGLIETFQWHEDAAKVVVKLSDGKGSPSYDLPVESVSGPSAAVTGIVDNLVRKGEGK